MGYKTFLFCFFFAFHALCAAGDQDLTFQPQQEVKEKPQTYLFYLFHKLIAFHQTIISPADGPRSHFKPSSSEYMLQAMKKYGVFWGFLRGCDRLIRENSDPWVYPTVVIDDKKYKWDPP